MTAPKVAIFYDWLNQWGGAEKVLQSLLKLYPNAPVYTLVYDKKLVPWLPKKTSVIPSIINKLPYSIHNPIIYTPLYALALEQFDLSKYDIVISTTSTIGHSLLTLPSTLFICYFHNINRYLYQTPPKYRFLSPLLKSYQSIDKIYSSRPDNFFCNSQTVSTRVQSRYLRPSQIINPGIDINFFKPSPTSTNDYFLTVSRLVPHKNIDLVIKYFSSSKSKLKIVGTGRQEKCLKKLASNSPNIEFLGPVSDKKLLTLYQNCSALICPQLEDFGLTPIEAQACGKPVIAYGRGGNTETILDGLTGVFYPESTLTSFGFAFSKFLSSKFDPKVCRHQAQKFSDTQFMLNFKQSVDSLWQRHQITTF